MLKKRIVLASNSPRRIALLKSLGYSFDIIPHRIEESIFHDILPTDLAQHLAFIKARDVSKRVDNAIIIAADTLIVYGNGILGKPKDTRDAKWMLSILQGSGHEIISGVCILEVPSGKKMLRFGRTHIKIKGITEKEIDEYVRTGEPLDKAGAYAVQGEGRKFVEKIEGSYSNAVGLPLEIVKKMINFFIE
ncbi:MAG: septum formation protein Maf [wastewater metagenome]|nr:septum formation protein Maf [Candidatus Loosdrechtia aerotolerans]